MLKAMLEQGGLAIYTNISPTQQIKLAVRVYADGMTMCCDVDFDKEGISNSRLYLAFTTQYQDFMDYHLLTSTAIAPTKDSKIDFEMIDKVNSNDNTDKKEQLAIVDKLNENGTNFESFTLRRDFADVLYFEFSEMLKKRATD